MPSRSRFLSDAEYHGARTHEVFHYLEQPWRLSWDKTVDKSELMAEVGISLVENYFRLPPAQDNTNIRKWLLVWDQRMQQSSQYLFDAIEQAERSLKYLITLQDQLKVG
jgi:antirestriction protein ArdC